MSTVSQFDSCRLIGRTALRFSKDWLNDPVVVATDFAEMMSQRMLDAHFDDLGETLKRSLLCNAMLCGRWAMSAFPVVTFGHSTASTMMAAKIKPEDAKEFVRAPWPAFGIRMPTPLLCIDDNGLQRDIGFILAGTISRDFLGDGFRADSEERWWYRLFADSPIAPLPELQLRSPELAPMFGSGISLWGFNLPAQAMAMSEDLVAQLDGYTRWDSQTSTSVDDRSERLARMLICSVCLYLTGDPRERERSGDEGRVKVTERKSKQRDGDDLPQYREFDLRSSVKINLTPAIREFVAHGGSSPAVQTFVGSHWKRVAHGPRHSLRRMQHILPYWRGDVDAPISTRSK